MRGILCFSCNIAIGRPKTTRTASRSAMAYLARDDLLTEFARRGWLRWRAEIRL